MNVSFGKFIPVKVFIDGNEIKSSDGMTVPKEVEQVTLTLADGLSKYKTYPDNMLIEQQRRFFASKVSDYKIPYKTAEEKTTILPSSVKTLNIEGKRYLVTGSDIAGMKDAGHNLGVRQKDNLEEMNCSPYTATADDNTFYRELEERNKGAKQTRINDLKYYMNKNSRTLPQTLYINAMTNPGAKLQRDRYRITLIDFKA